MFRVYDLGLGRQSRQRSVYVGQDVRTESLDGVIGDSGHVTAPSCHEVARVTTYNPKRFSIIVEGSTAVSGALYSSERSLSAGFSPTCVLSHVQHDFCSPKQHTVLRSDSSAALRHPSLDRDYKHEMRYLVWPLCCFNVREIFSCS